MARTKKVLKEEEIENVEENEFDENPPRDPEEEGEEEFEEEELPQEDEEELEEGSAAQDTLHPGSGSNAGTEPSRLETVSRALGVLANVDKDTLKYFNGMMATHFGKDFGIPDGAKEKNQGSIKAHPSAAVKEEIHSEITKMFTDNQLSEEFKEKATVLFEAAVEARVNAERVGLEEEYEARLEDELEAINEEIQNHLDKYVSYVAEEWLKENEVAIESSLRNEITTEFMSKLRELFVESNVNIPEDQIEVVDALAEKVEELESRLAEAIEENADLRELKEEVEKAEIVAEAAEGLTLVESEKFKELAEGVDASDVEEFQHKLGLIRESLKPSKTSNVETLLEEVNEDNQPGEEGEGFVDPAMRGYLDVIKRTVKSEK